MENDRFANLAGQFEELVKLEIAIKKLYQKIKNTVVKIGRTVYGRADTTKGKKEKA